jgi:ATP-binding cassette, subfamily B, bacterial
MKALARFSKSIAIGRRFLPELAGHRRQLWGVVALFVGSIALELARPWPLRWVIDGVLAPTADGPADPGRIVLLAGVALLAVLLGKALLEYLGTLLITAVGHAVTRALRLRVFRHLVGLSPDFHARHKSGDLLMRMMGDVPMLKDMLVDSSLQMSLRALQAVGIVILLFVIDPVLAAAVLVPLPILLFTIRLLSDRLRVAVRKQRRAEGEMADYLHEAIDAAVLLQALGRSGHAVHRFARSNRRSARAGMKVARAAARLGGTVEALLSVAFAGALTLGAWRVLDGKLHLGELTVFLSYVRGLLKPIRSASKHQARIAKGTACGERILHVLDETTEIKTPTISRVPALEPKTLVYEDVDYFYPDGRSALRGVNLRLRRGELAALVGPSGAGKSTLLALALRIFDPREGHVRLDGVPLNELDLDALRERFAISMQSTVLFGESIRENLLLGDGEASEAQLWAALEAAGAKDLVSDQPDQLDSVLGAGGVGLSGGEARRICLARALLRDAPILVVDEPFGGLDRATALHLVKTLRAAAQDRIVLVVTHAVEHLEAFERVIYLHQGQVIGDGPHVELVQRHASYASLVCNEGEAGA